MEHDFIERLAEDAYARTGLTTDGSRTALELADALLGGGARCAVFDLANLDEPAVVWTGARGESLLLRSGLTERAAEWFGARALARWMLRSFQPTGADIDLLTACLRAPRPAVRSMVHEVGTDFHELGDALEMSATSAALRVGEALGVRMVVHSPAAPPRIRGRGKPPIRWCRTQLSDDPNRYALVSLA